tara:strand:+ start:7887 stop:9284 length:1398 start_codon:yes stop_codon:yes gene_type:complete
MGRRVAPKSEREVRQLTYSEERNAKRYHAVGGDGAHGLVLMCQPPSEKGVPSARSWILRYTFAGRQQEMGLGSYPAVTLARAREKAREARVILDGGKNPLALKKEARRASRKTEAKAVAFSVLAADYMELRRQPYCGKSHATHSLKKIDKETNQLSRYAYPFLGNQLVDKITSEDVAEVLRPLRLDGKRETETQVRRNIAKIMDLAKARKLVDVNPVDRSVLRNLLPDTPSGKMKMLETAANKKNHPALDVADMPRFVSALSMDDTLGAKVLLFQILTAARPGEARLAKWQSVDSNEKLWRVPAEDMKTGVAHDVPLSERAVSLLKCMPRKGVYIFSRDGKKPVSENTANIRIKAHHTFDISIGGPGFVDSAQTDIRGNHPRAVAHGFRSTFKDWSRTVASFPDELTELALAHKFRIENAEVRASYARDKLVSRRRPIMEAWAKFCGSSEESCGKLVVPTGGRFP